MPNIPMTLVSAQSASISHPARAIFRVAPIMTKYDIAEYLRKIYHLPVLQVNTMNYDGKRKRIASHTKMHYYKYSDYKKAVVTFDPLYMTQVGIGTKTPEVDNTTTTTTTTTSDSNDKEN
jgi:ribosomal protein L23